MLLTARPSRLLSFAFGCTILTSITVVANEGKPYKWVSGTAPGQIFPLAADIALDIVESMNCVETPRPQPGEIVCQMEYTTDETPNRYTCAEMAGLFDVPPELIFTLNPSIEPDCGNLRPQTRYCVIGFLEPVRACDGLCGPPHGNATCEGTDAQCCNAETWTCGDTEEDCADGTCYEGDCLGDVQYSTDGTCRFQHGDRLCAGKQGNCCSMDGKCGTGPDFCGKRICQSGDWKWKPEFSESGTLEIDQ
ncbi:hypothetical protein GE09DRAFT_288076 [Coniochaeta sp. 2T2.1]|nr:hypothetical protein GE09DRAFT_288076 [Coniochaeta sp. 2T2.1]